MASVIRDRHLERRLLEAIDAPPAFAEEVLGRLDHFEAKHGNTGWEKAVDHLLAEMQEEAADIAGWGLGAAYQLEDAEIHHLLAAMRLGAAAWRELNELRKRLASR